MTKVLMIHPDKCTGCHNCSLACAYGHEGQFRPAGTRVHVYTWEREGFSVPMMCQQCDEASCMKVCPTGALHRAKGSALVFDASQTVIFDREVISLRLGFVGTQFTQNLVTLLIEGRFGFAVFSSSAVKKVTI